MGFYFVALILNNVMVQKESKKTDSRFKRKIYFKVNQLNLHRSTNPVATEKNLGAPGAGRMGASVCPS